MGARTTGRDEDGGRAKTEGACLHPCEGENELLDLLLQRHHLLELRPQHPAQLHRALSNRPCAALAAYCSTRGRLRRGRGTSIR